MTKNGLRSAKRPNPKADPNPDYKHRPWTQWLKRAEAGTLASTAAAVGHVKLGGLVGVVPGVHGIAVLDVDTGNPTDLERRYPRLALDRMSIRPTPFPIREVEDQILHLIEPATPS